MAKLAKKLITRRNAVLAVAAIVILLICTLLLVKVLSGSDATIPSTSPATNTAQPKTTQSNSQTKSEPSQSTSINDSKSTTSTPVTASNLKEPTGSFVSNHFPGKNGSPTSEQSVCNTQPGATCYIEFSKDGTIKKLTPQMADSSGSVYWSWDVKDAGLDAGSWQISAVATLNGQSKTAKDAMQLEVQP